MSSSHEVLRRSSCHPGPALLSFSVLSAHRTQALHKPFPTRALEWLYQAGSVRAVLRVRTSGAKPHRAMQSMEDGSFVTESTRNAEVGDPERPGSACQARAASGDGQKFPARGPANSAGRATLRCLSCANDDARFRPSNVFFQPHSRRILLPFSDTAQRTCSLGRLKRDFH